MDGGYAVRHWVAIRKMSRFCASPFLGKKGGVAADSVCVTVVKELVGRHKANHFDTPGRMPCPSERILPSIHNRKARGRSVPGQGPVRQALSRSGRHENGTDVSVNEIFEPGEPHR